MYYLSSKASRIRLREAQNARNNRAEIVKALSLGQITRRDLYKWGLLTTTGVIALKNGLSPLAPSAFADGVPTGTPPSPLFGAQKFTQRLNRLALQRPQPLTRTPHDANPNNDTARWPAAAGEVLPVSGAPKDAKRLSYHDDFSNNPGNRDFINPTTGVGPIEGRAPTDPKTGLAFFAHQRWDEFFPKVGYVMSWTQAAPNQKFHPNFPAQQPNSVWTYGTGNTHAGTLPPFLIQARYGEAITTRIYNNTPVDRAQNNGFGRNEQQLHYHNAHNGAESDGASNSHHFPGTFYDYRWSGTLARRDKINTDATDPRASTPDDNGGLVNVPGDWREIQGTMWAHDHRFFFTAENVYKGNLMMVSMYSGRDRGNETLNDGINLRLPSGSHRANQWGNLDFDVNLIVSDLATDPTSQLFFDIFTTDGFVGDIEMVNFQYAPFMEVLPRKYRFRILSAGMSRFIQLQIADSLGNPVPFLQIANDGNLFVNPVQINGSGQQGGLEQQGTAERYDIIVDFSRFRIGDTAYLVNTLQSTTGLKPDGQVQLAQAFADADNNDPAVGRIMQFRIVSQVQSVDDPTVTLRATDPDPSQVPTVLTEQIPIVTPARTRVVQWGRIGNGDSVSPVTGQCTPDCGLQNGFPWTVVVDGGQPHSMNANRVSLEYQKPGTIEHWTYVNSGGGWDHPIHLHFEEGITLNRGGQPIGPTELNVRKDVWRLRPSGQVTFQIQFGEYGGAYVNHCHNTVHEDFALLMRIQLLNGFAGTPQAIVTRTPNPSPDC